MCGVHWTMRAPASALAKASSHTVSHSATRQYGLHVASMRILGGIYIDIDPREVAKCMYV